MDMRSKKELALIAAGARSTPTRSGKGDHEGAPLDAGNHFHDGADGKLRAMEKIAMGIEKKLTMN
jgi:hypothetical protein